MNLEGFGRTHIWLFWSNLEQIKKWKNFFKISQNTWIFKGFDTYLTNKSDLELTRFEKKKISKNFKIHWFSKVLTRIDPIKVSLLKVKKNWRVLTRIWPFWSDLEISRKKKQSNYLKICEILNVLTRIWPFRSDLELSKKWNFFFRNISKYMDFWRFWHALNQ